MQVIHREQHVLVARQPGKLSVLGCRWRLQRSARNEAVSGVRHALSAMMVIVSAARRTPHLGAARTASRRERRRQHHSWSLVHTTFTRLENGIVVQNFFPPLPVLKPGFLSCWLSAFLRLSSLIRQNACTPCWEKRTTIKCRRARAATRRKRTRGRRRAALAAIGICFARAMMRCVIAKR